VNVDGFIRAETDTVSPKCQWKLDFIGLLAPKAAQVGKTGWPVLWTARAVWLAS